MAKAKVPINTITFSTFTRKIWSNCMMMVKPAKQHKIIVQVWVCIHAFTSGVINVRSLAPLMRRKYTMAVAQMPPNKPIFHRKFLR